MKKQKLVIRRRKASQDIDDAVDYYFEESSSAALSFIDELEHAFLHISQHPATGSNRYAQVVTIPNLKSWALSRFPYIILYLSNKDHIDVLRVFHTRRDISHLLLLDKDFE